MPILKPVAQTDDERKAKQAASKIRTVHTGIDAQGRVGMAFFAKEDEPYHLVELYKALHAKRHDADAGGPYSVYYDYINNEEQLGLSVAGSKGALERVVEHLNARQQEHKANAKKSGDKVYAKIEIHDVIRANEDGSYSLDVTNLGNRKARQMLINEINHQFGHEVKAHEHTVHDKEPILRVRWEGKQKHDDAQSALADKQRTLVNGYLKDYTGEDGKPFFADDMVADKEPEGYFKRMKHRFDEEYRYNKRETTGKIYLFGNTLNFISGMLRGNVGEAFTGLFFALSNFNLALGKRPDRSESELMDDVRKEFTTAGGELDLTKDEGFTSGHTKYGSLVDDFLNWRDKGDNYYSVLKVMPSFFAGLSSLWGGIKDGKKSLETDEAGNVVLDEFGRAVYTKKLDPALLVSGVLVTGAYGSSMIHPKYSDGEPLFRPSGMAEALSGIPIVGGLFKGATEAAEQSKAPMNDKEGLGKIVDSVHREPVSYTGQLMRLHSAQQVGWATLDTIVTRPQKLNFYTSKFTQERFQLFTEAGGAKSLMHRYIGPDGIFQGVSQLVDATGELTLEAVNAKNAYIANYESRLQEFKRLTAKFDDYKTKNTALPNDPHIQELNRYLETNRKGYEDALLLGTFDLKDKETKSGIPLINRSSTPGSYQKLIALHEEKLASPYIEVERGGDEERAYVSALNRKNFQRIEDGWWLAPLRFVYNFANVIAASVLSSVKTETEKREYNAVDQQLDLLKLYHDAADLVYAQTCEVLHGNEAERASYDPEAVYTAIKNVTKKLYAQDEVNKIDGLSEEGIRRGVRLAIYNRYAGEGVTPDGRERVLTRDILPTQLVRETDEADVYQDYFEHMTYDLMNGGNDRIRGKVQQAVALFQDDILRELNVSRSDLQQDKNLQVKFKEEFERRKPELIRQIDSELIIRMDTEAFAQSYSMRSNQGDGQTFLPPEQRRQQLLQGADGAIPGILSSEDRVPNKRERKAAELVMTAWVEHQAHQLIPDAFANNGAA